MDIEEILKKYHYKTEHLLLILHEAQQSNPHHCIPEENIRRIAEGLKSTYAQVYGVVTYYSMFSTKKRGKYIIRVCESPLCHMMQDDNLLEILEKHLSISCGETTPDFLFTIEKSECLGICDKAPAMMINENIYGPLNKEIIMDIIQQLQERERHGK